MIVPMIPISSYSDKVNSPYFKEVLTHLWELIKNNETNPKDKRFPRDRNCLKTLARIQHDTMINNLCLEAWILNDDDHYASRKHKGYIDLGCTAQYQEINKIYEVKLRMEKWYFEKGLFGRIEPLSISHIYPRCLGGAHHPDNLGIETLHENQVMGKKLDIWSRHERPWTPRLTGRWSPVLRAEHLEWEKHRDAELECNRARRSILTLPNNCA